jgi:hypothetical protein
MDKNNQKLLYCIFLSLVGMGYFSFFSSLEISIFFRGLAVLFPIQIGTLIYIWSSGKLKS